MKKLAIALSIFPGTLFVVALVSYVICSYAERDLPPGGVNIGLSLVLLAALVNIPTMVAWLVFIVRKRGGNGTTPDENSARKSKNGASFATYLSTAVVVGGLSCGAIAIYAQANNTPDADRVSSIGEWEKRTRRLAFTLLDKAELPGYYICVYDTGMGEVAICYNQKQPEAASRHLFGVYDTNGRNLQDPARWNKTSELNRPGDTYPISGMVVSVSPDYRGKIQIEFKEDTGSGFKSVYKKLLPYNLVSETGSSTQPAITPGANPQNHSNPKPESEKSSR